jgi:serine/threonine-protein kinase RsbW
VRSRRSRLVCREGILLEEGTDLEQRGGDLMAQRGPAPTKPVAAGAPEVSLTIPVAPEMEIVATAQADALGEYMDMTRDKIDEVKLALVEACINAFEHAHTEDKQVHITFRVGGDRGTGEWLEIDVRDRGRGFDAEGIVPPSPQKAFEERRRRGWGLHIIKSLMDDVQITSGGWGTRILMRKYK